jgi:hypothetical protein
MGAWAFAGLVCPMGCCWGERRGLESEANAHTVRFHRREGYGVWQREDILRCMPRPTGIWDMVGMADALWSKWEWC